MELPRQDLLLYAALLHGFLQKDPENKQAKTALDNLIEQTEFVTRDPKNHKIKTFESHPPIETETPAYMEQLVLDFIPGE